jgi:hypothetical protein
VSFLCQYSRQQSDDCPAEETSVCGSVAPVEKGVLFLRMAVNVTKDPDLTFLIVCDILHDAFRVVDLWMKQWLWVDPLSVQINACN